MMSRKVGRLLVPAQGGGKITLEEMVTNVVTSEVEIYASYLEGDVHGIVFDKFSKVDGEWELQESDEDFDVERGFFGSKNAETNLQEEFDSQAEDMEKDNA